MKDKILYLIIGFLIGSIITTSAFLIYNKILEKSSNKPEMMQTNENGQSGIPSKGNMGESPAKPYGDNGEEPPSMPNQNGGTSPKMQSNSNNNNI